MGPNIAPGEAEEEKGPPEKRGGTEREPSYWRGEMERAAKLLYSRYLPTTTFA